MNSSVSLPPKPTRRTTKLFALLCIGGALAVLVLAILVQETALEHLAWPAAFVIVGVFTAYTGTGSADLWALAGMVRGAPPMDRRFEDMAG